MAPRVREARAVHWVGSFAGWLYSVCRSVCLAAERKRSTRDSTLADVGLTRGAPPPAPDTAAEDEEMRRSLQRAVMELPAREREVVVLRLVEGRSVRETALAMGCAEGTVKAALHHAMRKLEANMEVWAR